LKAWAVSYSQLIPYPDTTRIWGRFIRYSYTKQRGKISGGQEK
jgi:hypothetical protein